MKKKSCGSNDGIVDAHVTDLEVLDVFHDDCKPFVLYFHDGESNNDNTVEDAIKLPHTTNRRYYSLKKNECFQD